MGEESERIEKLARQDIKKVGGMVSAVRMYSVKLEGLDRHHAALVVDGKQRQVQRVDFADRLRRLRPALDLGQLDDLRRVGPRRRSSETGEYVKRTDEY